MTWRKWGYLPVDSGRELYVPAAIVAGKKLYFDLWYPYGPLIPHWHAALFRIFGIHLGVLLASGLSIVIAITLLLYSVGRSFLPPSLSFAAVFAFLVQAFQADLFNYILPYSYSAAYGSMFSVLLLWLLLREHRVPGALLQIAAGSVAGLMALTKVEFGLAAYACLAAALALRAFETKSLSASAKLLCAFLPGAILAAGIYGWYLHAAGADLLLGQNLSLLPGSHYQQHFAALWNRTTGLDLAQQALALSIARGLAGFLGVAACIALASRFKWAGRLLPALALGLCLVHFFVSLTGATERFTLWADRESIKILRPLFFNSGMIWTCLLLAALACAGRRSRPAEFSSAVLLAVIAAACGIRALTKITPWGYSMFFDVLVYLAWLVALCRASARFSVDLTGAFGAMLAFVLCLSTLALTLERYPIRQRSYPISSERGLLYASPELGRGFSQALAFLEAAKQASQSVVILPEDTSLYFLSGTLAPSRWYLVLPQVLAPGKATSDYLAELERANPRYILITDRSTTEFGLPVFGIDYGQRILAWVKQHYRVTRQIGDFEPVAYPRAWGALVYERQ